MPFEYCSFVPAPELAYQTIYIASVFRQSGVNYALLQDLHLMLVISALRSLPV